MLSSWIKYMIYFSSCFFIISVMLHITSELTWEEWSRWGCFVQKKQPARANQDLSGEIQMRHRRMTNGSTRRDGEEDVTGVSEEREIDGGGEKRDEVEDEKWPSW
jgi:hypothetical protein